MKGITFTDNNLNKAIKDLRDSLKKNPMGFAPTHVLVPKCKKVLSERYSGKGRPKKIDYDYVEIDWENNSLRIISFKDNK